MWWAPAAWVVSGLAFGWGWRFTAYPEQPFDGADIIGFALFAVAGPLTWPVLWLGMKLR
jgi:hypothetical protein